MIYNVNKMKYILQSILYYKLYHTLNSKTKNKLLSFFKFKDSSIA